MKQLLSKSEQFKIHHGDCIPHMLAEMPENSVDFAVFSPPFPALYAYSDAAGDIGNVDSVSDEARIHLSFFFKGLLRVLKPGRVAICHVCQIPRLKRNMEHGIHDFRGMCLRLAERAGFYYEYDWAVRKCPQALRDGTNVLTPSGWQAIDTLSVGQKVIGSNGKATNVLGVYKHESRQMYRVTFSDGTSVECDDNHLWQVSTVNGGSRTMTTKEIREFGTHSPSGVPRFKIPIISGSVEFKQQEELPLDPYTLGVILGDGSTVTRSSVFITTEIGVIRNCKVPVGHSLTKTKGGDRGNNVSCYYCKGNDWHNNETLFAIRELGLNGKRAWEKFVPKRYLLADPYSRLEILRGLMDTDGTIKTRNGICCKFCTTSEQLADDVQFLAESLGGVARRDIEDNSKYEYKGEIRTGRRKYLVSIRMPEGCNPFKLDRKANRWKPTKKTICRFIKSIEATSHSTCTCIEVDAPDHLYVTENHIVTHNSQSIRNRVAEMSFTNLERDRTRSRGAILDYLIKLKKPGENKVPVSNNEVTRNDWIKYAEGCWTDIIETDTLNTKAAKSEDDVRHIAPLQLEVIRRCVLMYSNPGEIVFSPFTGIGSEGYVSLGGVSPKTGNSIANPRRFYGCELKPEYFNQANKNLRSIASRKNEQVDLFELMNEDCDNCETVDESEEINA